MTPRNTLRSEPRPVIASEPPMTVPTPRPALLVVLLSVLMVSMQAPASGQSDPDAPVAAERAEALIDRAIRDTERRLELLQQARQRLQDGEAVSREELSELVDRPPNATGRGAEGRVFDGRLADRLRRRQAGDALPGLESMDGSRQPDQVDDRWNRPWSELAEEDRTRVLDFLREHAPAASQRLTDNPGPMAERLLGRTLAPRAIKVLRAQDADPRWGELALEEFKAGAGLFDAGRRLRQAFIEGGESSDAFAEARQAFRQAMGRELDAKLAMRHFEFEQLEAQLADQRQALERETSRRDQRLDASLEEVVLRLRASQSEDRGRRREPR